MFAESFRQLHRRPGGGDGHSEVGQEKGPRQATEPAKLRDADKRRETFLAVQAVAIQNPNVRPFLDSLGLAQLLNVQSPGV